MASKILLEPFLLVIGSTLIVSSHPQECAHPLPSLDKTASGIDITKLDFLPFGPSDSWAGFVENVFSYKCNGGIWRDGDYYDSPQYDVPDDLKDSIGCRDCIVPFNHYSIDENVLDAKRTRLSIFESNSRNKGFFSQNRMYQSLLKQYFDSGKIFAEIKTTTRDIWIDAKNYTGTRRLSNEFVEFFSQKLPPKYEDNPSIYQAFVRRFGTHYSANWDFGFGYYLQFAINQQYAFEHTDEQIMRNLRVAFYRAFNISQIAFDDLLKGENAKTCQVDEDFAKNSEIIFVLGASGSIWVDKVSGKTFVADKNSDRVLLSAELHDLDELVYNETIKAQVKTAIRMYLIKAYLGELKNVYNYTNYQLSSEEMASLVQVETMLKESDIQKMNQTEEIIDQLYKRFSLFTDKKLCYPTLRDFYVTANLKVNFAKSICANSPGNIFKGHTTRLCPRDQMIYGQKEVNEFFSSYENGKEEQDCVKGVRKLNGKYSFMNDLYKGLEAICAKCY